MKIEIELKPVTIRTKTSAESTQVIFEKVPGYCFQWASGGGIYELACIRSGVVGWYCMVLVKTGCGIMDPFRSVDPLAAIFGFMGLSEESRQYIEKTIQHGIGNEEKHSHAFDIVAADRNHRSNLQQN